MEELILYPGIEDIGKRVDVYISAATDMTRSYAAKLCDEENVSCGGVLCTKKYKIKSTEAICVMIPEPEIIDVQPEDIPLDVVYEDSEIIVINKPQGMVVHPANGVYNGTLVNGIMYHCGKSLSGINGEIRPGIVHRIDKDTSGLLVIAKTNEAHLSLNEQWKSTKPDRKYMALVHGNIKEDNFTVDLPVGRSKTDRKKMAVTNDGRNAVTHVSVIERFGRYTLVECVLDTGRTHQIRVHMSYMHHPIVGDKTYGVKKEEFNLEGQLLHAKTLGFIHPRTKEKKFFSSEIPDYFENVLKILRGRA